MEITSKDYISSKAEDMDGKKTFFVGFSYYPFTSMGSSSKFEGIPKSLDIRQFLIPEVCEKMLLYMILFYLDINKQNSHFSSLSVMPCLASRYYRLWRTTRVIFSC
jgi:hypothetical protein